MDSQEIENSQRLAANRIFEPERYWLTSMGNRHFLTAKLSNVADHIAGIDNVLSCKPGMFPEFFDHLAAYVTPTANELIGPYFTSPVRRAETAVSEANTR